MNFIQAKDIQLLFDVETVPLNQWEKGKVDLNGCIACYNTPCTCDNKGNHTKLNPYNLKREDDVPILKKTDLECDYTYFDDVLIKKSKNEN